MKKFCVLLCAFGFTCLQAQDSLTKRFKHEVGFNTILLIKQVLSNNANSASSTLPQLPYQLIYTLHYQNMVGLRLGAGYMSTENESVITGQPKPKVTNSSSGAYRGGINYNFVRTPKITANCFVDGIYERNHSKTVTTTTVPAGPFGGTTDDTVETEETTSGGGVSFGIGLKYSFNKYISVYTETPIQIKNLYTTSTATESSSGVQTSLTVSSGNERTMKIIIPATLFLTISF